MPRFSANLGYLWTELNLPDAIRASAAAGFDAVECQLPYATPVDSVLDALEETGLPMLGLNTRIGINGREDFGVMALPGRESEAREYVEEAIEYASAIGARHIHCVAGRSGRTSEAETVFRQNLLNACMLAAPYGLTIVIEPINQRDAPGYHLSRVAEGLDTIRALGADNLKLMFDCYHIQIMQGDLINHLRDALPDIAHIQFAGVPDRGEPDQGEVNYPWLFAQLDYMGWGGFLGAEYKPSGPTAESLGWLSKWRTG